MTAVVLITCDGTPRERPTIALERCRGFLPLGAPSSPADVAARLNAAGWRRLDPGARDLCPSCARHVVRPDGCHPGECAAWRCAGRCNASPWAPALATDRCAHSSTMKLGDRRVCADCGVPRG